MKQLWLGKINIASIASCYEQLLFLKMKIITEQCKNIHISVDWGLSSRLTRRPFCHFSKGERTAPLTAVYVRVQSGTPPSVEIETPEGQHDPSTPLIIKAFVSSPLAFEATWSSMSGEGKKLCRICQLNIWGLECWIWHSLCIELPDQ